jgi:hypothetical protein
MILREGAFHVIELLGVEERPEGWSEDGLLLRVRDEGEEYRLRCWVDDVHLYDEDLAGKFRELREWDARHRAEYEDRWNTLVGWLAAFSVDEGRLRKLLEER